MPMPERPSDLSRLSLADIAQMAAEQRLPPVDQWAPTKFGHSEMRIARDARWFHQGEPIRRETMVRLFSTILRRDPDGRHYLVTPVEKLEIDVDDTPFLAVEVKSEGEGPSRMLAFRLNTGDLILAGPDHPLRLTDLDGEPLPILMVRGGMAARIARPVYYALAEWAIAEAHDPIGLWSGDTFFPLVSR
jgi:hypothetical protein